jgi:mono/diheme cytochrome c family protein
MRARMMMAVVGLAALFGLPQARAAGDAAKGHALAQRWCSSCHLVDESGQAPDTAPPFSIIARRHGPNRDWVRAWLAAPHPPMPNFDLTRQQIDDVVAYLDSLTKK